MTTLQAKYNLVERNDFWPIHSHAGGARAHLDERVLTVLTALDEIATLRNARIASISLLRLRAQRTVTTPPAPPIGSPTCCARPIRSPPRSRSGASTTPLRDRLAPRSATPFWPLVRRVRMCHGGFPSAAR
ncbi:hypothetical protein [Saccharopolyspora sp. NPDC002686]|uniref:hypothetical protein n=1 Tax=Saccharopolyspora sp. NPDC002686 TaxID=3154541 RepID=UPI00331CE169